jgi:hypothetical protein
MPSPLLEWFEHELEALAEALVPRIITKLQARGVIPASPVTPPTAPPTAKATPKA